MLSTPPKSELDIQMKGKCIKQNKWTGKINRYHFHSPIRPTHVCSSVSTIGSDLGTPRSPIIGQISLFWNTHISLGTWKVQNCWNKSCRTSKILTLLYQQFSNALICQRDISGPRLGALSNNWWSGGNSRVSFRHWCYHCKFTVHLYPGKRFSTILTVQFIDRRWRSSAFQQYRYVHPRNFISFSPRPVHWSVLYDSRWFFFFLFLVSRRRQWTILRAAVLLDTTSERINE